MNKEEQLQFMHAQGMITIVRIKEPGELIRAAEALEAGGVRVLEFTVNTPNALEAISTLARTHGERILLGAGTVLDPETTREALLAGAQFIVAPNFNPAVVELARRYSKIVVPGTLTPTEIIQAWESGADFVKIFPASVGGPQYIKDLLGPLPHIRLVPTGGVGLDNIPAYFAAGAALVAVGLNLADPKLIQEGNWTALTEKARLFVETVQAHHMRG